MFFRKVCPARRCYGCPSLYQVSVSKPRRLWATVLNHPDSGQCFHVQWSLEGAVKKGKLFYSVSPQDILEQREAHFFKPSRNKPELHVARQVSLLFSLINCMWLLSSWENKSTWVLHFKFNYFKHNFNDPLYSVKHAFEQYVQLYIVGSTAWRTAGSPNKGILKARIFNLLGNWKHFCKLTTCWFIELLLH